MTTLSTVRGREALACSTVFTCLATVLVAIRIYTRAFMVKQMGLDDYAILVALVRADSRHIQAHEILRLTLALGFLMGFLRIVRGW